MGKDYLAVGIIGLGDHGTEKILPALAQVPHAKITATCDIIESRALYGYQNYGARNHYADFREMIDKENLDAVIVAVGPQIHYDVTQYAVQRGVSVFVEKPPALLTEQMMEMAKLSEMPGIITGVGLNFRYTATIQMIKQILDESGDNDFPVWTAVKHTAAKPRGKSPWPVSFDRAFLLMQAIHPLDTLIFFNGRVQKTSLVAQKGERGVVFSCNFAFANGAIGNLVTGSTSANFSNYLEIETHLGKIFRVDHLWNLYFLDQKRPIKMIDAKRWEYAWRPSPTDSGYKRSGYVNELERYLECVKNQTPFSPSFKDVIHHYEVMDSIEEELTHW